jgi:uncharacterized RDD family membrane protein YckC
MATGWWQRVGATIIDILVLIIPTGIIEFAAGRIVGGLIATVIEGAYLVFLISQQGRTVGNRAVGTRVVGATDGAQPTLNQALARWAPFGVVGVLDAILPVLAIIGGLFILIDILWPLWDKQNQTLHDKIGSTLVVKNQ